MDMTPLMGSRPWWLLDNGYPGVHHLFLHRQEEVNPEAGGDVGGLQRALMKKTDKRQTLMRDVYVVYVSVGNSNVLRHEVLIG